MSSTCEYGMHVRLSPRKFGTIFVSHEGSFLGCVAASSLKMACLRSARSVRTLRRPSSAAPTSAFVSFLLGCAMLSDANE